MAGTKAHNALKALLKKYGLAPICINRNQEFQFGDGKVEPSYYTFIYPVVINGVYVGDIPLAEVAVPCPALFSKQMQKEWQMIVDFGNDKWTSPLMNLEMKFRHATPVVPIADYGDVKSFDKKAMQIPSKFWMKGH